MKALQTFGTLVTLALAPLVSSAADTSVKANEVEILSDGKTRLSGDVVLSTLDTNTTVSSERVTATLDGVLLEGNVRFEVGNIVLTTDRAHVAESDRFEAKMDTAISASL